MRSKQTKLKMKVGTKETACRELLIDLRISLVQIILLALLNLRLEGSGARLVDDSIICLRDTSSFLLANGNSVVGLIPSYTSWMIVKPTGESLPLLEGCSIDGNDAVLYEGLCAHQFVVGCVVNNCHNSQATTSSRRGWYHR